MLISLLLFCLLLTPNSLLPPPSPLLPPPSNHTHTHTHTHTALHFQWNGSGTVESPRDGTRTCREKVVCMTLQCIPNLKTALLLSCYYLTTTDERRLAVLSVQLSHMNTSSEHSSKGKEVRPGDSFSMFCMETELLLSRSLSH